MKRNYVTPVIAVEHYNLTQSIAACERKIGWNNKQCVETDGDSTPEMKELSALSIYVECTIRFDDMGVDEYDGICYHTSANAAFTSG